MIDFEQAIKDGIPPSQDVIDEDKAALVTKLNSHLKKIAIGVTLFAVIGAWVYATLLSVNTVGFYSHLKLFAAAFLGAAIVAMVVSMVTTVLLQVNIKDAGFFKMFTVSAVAVGFSGAASAIVAHLGGIGVVGEVIIYLVGLTLGFLIGDTASKQKGIFWLMNVVVSHEVYSDLHTLWCLKENGLFSAYFKELGAMNREITKAEVEAMESILEDKAAIEIKESIYGGNPKPNDQSKYGKIFSGVYEPDDCVYSISRDEYGIVEKVFPAQYGRSPWMIVGFLDDVKLEYLVDGIDIRTGKLDLLPWGQYCTDYGERQRHPYETEATKNKSFIRSNDNE